MKRRALCPLLLLAALSSGCVTLSGEAPSGIKFSRTAFGVNPAVGKLVVDAKPDGTFRMTISALDSNSTEALTAIVQGAVQGAAAAVKP
jgi:hypothetical protein